LNLSRFSPEIEFWESLRLTGRTVVRWISGKMSKS
jgi:hypothetical protein